MVDKEKVAAATDKFVTRNYIKIEPDGDECSALAIVSPNGRKVNFMYGENEEILDAENHLRRWLRSVIDAECKKALEAT